MNTIETPITRGDLEILNEVSDALSKDKQQKVKQKQLRGEDSTERLKALPKILRAIGAIVLVAAAAVYMLQSWEGFSYLERYFSFLGFTGILAAAGFFCGLKIKEDKGARTFLALSAAVVPVHFCQLGALLYSLRPVASASSYPVYLKWVAPSAIGAFGTVGVALVVLAPILFIAFTSLVRAEAKRFTVAFFIVNLLLLLPFREANIVGLILFAMVGVITFFEIAYLRHAACMRTKEGTLTRIMIWTPVVLIIGRNLVLHNLTPFFFSMGFAALAASIFFLAPIYSRTKRDVLSKLQATCVLPAFLSSCNAALALKDMLYMSDELLVPVTTVTFVVALVAMSMHCIGKGRGYVRLAGYALITGVLLQFLVFPGLASSFLCLVIGIITVSYGFTTEQRALFFSGTWSVIAGLLYYVYYALTHAELIYSYIGGPWVCLAIVGTVTILASSYLEAHLRQIIHKVREISAEVANWEN